LVSKLFFDFFSKLSTTAFIGLIPLLWAARAIACAPVGFVNKIATKAPAVCIAKTEPSVFPKYHIFKPNIITDKLINIDPNVVHFVPAWSLV